MLVLGAVTVDLERGEVRAADGSTVALTANECQLLAILSTPPNRTVSRDQLLTEALGYRAGLSTRALSNAVLRLRQKLEADPADPVHLKTVYGIGYRLELPEEGSTLAPAGATDAGLVGRDADLQRLAAAVRAGRLVTLVGPAGVGKTTLARHLLRQQPQGLFIDLVGRRSPAQVEQAAALALGISLRSGQVLRSLAARGGLVVVLDNAEQAIEAVAEVVGRWLAGTGARLVVTSRRPLGVEGEQVLSLAPLDLAAGVRLFQVRAPWLDGTLARLEPVVARLDGLPLAIELAAARSRTLALPELAARLGTRVEVLRVGHPEVAPRQASMHAALEGSWELLSPVEQGVLTACACFSGPFLATEVEGLLPGTADLLPCLDRLLSHSLLVATPPAELRMLSTVRDFVRRRSAPDQARHLSARLQHWAVQTGEQHAATLHKGGWATGFEVLRRLEPELEATWLAARDEDPALAARAALVLDAAWLQHGHRETHLALLQQARALPGLDPVLRARLDAALGLQLLEGGEAQAALDVLELREGPEVPASTRLALLRFRSVALLGLGQAGAARALLEAGLAQAREAGDRWHEGMLLTTLSRLELACGDPDGAERSALQALPLLRQTGHRFGEGNVRERLGRILTARGDLAGALAEYERERELWASLHVATAEATSLISQGSVLLHRFDDEGRVRSTFDPARAGELLDRARTLLRREGWVSRETFALLNLVCVGVYIGELDRAEAWLVELEELLLLGPNPALLDWLTPLIGSVVSTRAGRVEQARSRRRRGLLLCPEPAQAGCARALLEEGPGPQAPAGALRVLWELLRA